MSIPSSPAKAVLDAVPNPHAGEDYVVRFVAPEFTCLCPITGQPDFACFVIDYCPAKSLLESKSFKLFLASFRNTGSFHEDCTVQIGKRIVAAVRPKVLRIAGYWNARGGIPISVFWQTGALPAGLELPPLPAREGRERNRARAPAVGGDEDEGIEREPRERGRRRSRRNFSDAG